MKFTFSDNADGRRIRSYEAGRLRIGDRVVDHSVVITTDSLKRWDVTSPGSLTAEDLLTLAQGRPDVLVLGTGEIQIFPPLEVRHALLGTGIGLEIMSTGAAARTYNILISEERSVVAALIV